MGDSTLARKQNELPSKKKAHDWENLDGNLNSKFETPLRVNNSKLQNKIQLSKSRGSKNSGLFNT